MHDIEHQITYPGSNFIFHDSQGFESGSNEELEIAWKFIEEKSVETELKNQLHAIWYLALPLYCIIWLLPIGTVYPWTALVPFYLQNLNSSIKGQAEASLIVFCVWRCGHAVTHMFSASKLRKIITNQPLVRSLRACISEMLGSLARSWASF